MRRPGGSRPEAAAEAATVGPQRPAVAAPLTPSWSGLTTVLRGIAASVGISGLLASVGYVVQFSQEDLLGVALSTDTSVQAFVLQGARFLADLCLFLISSVERVALSASTAVACFVSVRALAGRRSIRRWITRPFWPSFALLVLLAADLVCNDLPATYVERLLFKEDRPGEALIAQPQPPWPVPGLTMKLRKQVICSRVNVAGCGALETWAYKLRLENWFFRNLLVSLVLIVASVRRLATLRKPPFAESVVATLLGLAVVLNAFAIPFAYAKTIKPTRFPDVEVLFKEEELATSSATDAAVPHDGAATAPDASGEDLPSVPRSESAPRTELSAFHWYLLHDTEATLVLYNQEGSQVWSVRKDLVRAITILQEGDVLKTHFLSTLQNSDQNEEEEQEHGSTT